MSKKEKIKLDNIEDAIESIRKGEVIIVVDDENRENEGDFLAAAEKITPTIINFMAKEGRGLICVPLSEKRCKEIKLERMVSNSADPMGTAFTISVDLKGKGVTTGISAKDSSTGEQKAMLISIVLANARALKLELGYPPVILLDEISAHLDIDRRGALYQEINALGAQAWMTGTDKNLFSEFGCKAKYFHVIESSGISDIKEVDFSVD